MSVESTWVCRKCGNEWKANPPTICPACSSLSAKLDEARTRAEVYQSAAIYAEDARKIKMKEQTPPEVNNSLLVCGMLYGMAFRLNDKILEEWLDTNPEDFRYAKMCREVIAFKRAINNLP